MRAGENILRTYVCSEIYIHIFNIYIERETERKRRVINVYKMSVQIDIDIERYR